MTATDIAATQVLHLDLDQLDDETTLAVETIAIALGRATQPGAAGLGMRARRELALLAYQTINRQASHAAADRFAGEARRMRALQQADYATADGVQRIRLAYAATAYGYMAEFADRTLRSCPVGALRPESGS